MERRKQVLWLTAVVSLAAMLAGNAAMGAEVLTAEEMGAIEGGCGGTQYFCISHWCGGNMPCATGFCGYPDYGPCNPFEKSREWIDNCASIVGPVLPCTRTNLEDCGTWWECYCYPSMHEDYCMINPSGQYGSQGLYYPCP